MQQATQSSSIPSSRKPPPPFSLIALAATIAATIGFLSIGWLAYSNRIQLLQFVMKLK